MIMKLVRLCIVLLMAVAGSAHANFHLWRVTEIYSNADGSVQFIELTALSSGQQFLAGHTITSTQGTLTRSITYPTNLPGDTATTTGGGGYYGGDDMTTYKSFLIGTQGLAALNVITPDYIVPNGFLFTSNGRVNFADVEIVSYASLPTTGGLSIDRSGATAMNSPINFAGVMATLVAAPAPLNYSDMWWVGQAENGWGLSIQQHGNIQFIAIYVYDSAGKPTWYVMPGGTWNANFSTYTGLLYQPTSAPLNNYNLAQYKFEVGTSPGNITLNFTSNSTATMQYTINGVSGQKSLERQPFGTGTSPLTVGDMWWAGSTQDGWGINLVQHAGIVFGVWYTYGPDGKPTWYVLPNGSWNGTTYSGPFYSTTGSAWVGATYDPVQLKPIEAGTLNFSFTGANNATMNYTFTTGTFAGTTQSKAIVRQPY